MNDLVGRVQHDGGEVGDVLKFSSLEASASVDAGLEEFLGPGEARVAGRRHPDVVLVADDPSHPPGLDGGAEPGDILQRKVRCVVSQN